MSLHQARLQFSIDPDVELPAPEIDGLVAGDVAELRIRVYGLEEGDDLPQAAFTAKRAVADADDAVTTVQAIARGTTEADQDMGIFSVPLAPRERVVVFRLTSADTTKLLTATTYNVRLWVVRNGQALMRSTLNGTITAEAGATGAIKLTFTGSGAITTPALEVRGEGVQRFKGAGGLTAPAVAIAGAGKQRFKGSGAVARPLAIAGSGDNGVFLKWDLGQSLASAGLILSAPAGRTYFDSNGVLVSAVGADVFRESSYHLNEAGVWTQAGLLELGSSSGVAYLAPTKAQLTAPTADVTDVPGRDGVGGFAKWTAFGTDRSINQLASQAVTVAAGTVYTPSVVVEMADGSVPVCSDLSTAGDFSILLEGARLTCTVRRLGASNRYLISGSRTAVSSGSVSMVVQRYTTQSGKAFWVTGWQCDPLPIATSRINAIGTPLSRAAELLSFNYPFGMPVAGMSMLVDCLDLGTWALTNTPRYIQVGVSTNRALLHGLNVGGRFGARYDNGSGGFSSAAPVTAVSTQGRRLQLRSTVSNEAKATLGWASNGGAEDTLAGLATAYAAGPTDVATGYINGSGPNAGRMGLLSARIARGLKSQAQLVGF